MGSGASKAAGFTALKHCTLWKSDRSPACRAVMMAIDAMKLSLAEVELDLDKGEHRAEDIVDMNPLQTVPIFKDRELILRDSHAICTYLATRYCESDWLLPTDPGRRALVDQYLHYNGGVLYPRFTAAANPLLYEKCNQVMPQQVSDMECAYSELEVMLAARTWFGGSRPTLADLVFSSTVSTMNVLVPVDSCRFPRLSSWLFRVSKEPFYMTGNSKGLSEFSKRIERGCSHDEEPKLSCPLCSYRRREIASEAAPSR